MTEQKHKELKDRALKVREHIVRLSTDGAASQGHLCPVPISLYISIPVFSMYTKTISMIPTAIFCCCPKDMMCPHCMVLSLSWDG